MKKYLAIRWTDDTHTIVPKAWVEDRAEKTCRYPTTNVIENCKNAAEPCDDWPVFNYKEILADASKYFKLCMCDIT